MTELRIVSVDAREVLRMLDGAQDAIDRLVDEVSEEVSETAPREAGGASTRLGSEPWETEGTGAVERRIQAPEFFAHFLARGTRGHGPTSAPRLMFNVDGRVASAAFVQGVRPDPFDTRTVEKVSGRADDVLDRLIREMT